MTNINEFGIHTVEIGNLVHMWDNTYGILTDIQLISGKPAVTIHYVSKDFPNKVTTFCGMFSELREWSNI